MQRSGIVTLLTGLLVLTGCGGGISGAKMESGKKVYQLYCQTCHMEDGGGVPGMNASLAGSKYIAGDKEKLAGIVLRGSAAFTNDAERKFQNKMPSLAALTDQEIADVLTYIRNSFTNKGSVVEPEDVKRVREMKN
jgi:mono/diheme cytochrome c family protein